LDSNAPARTAFPYTTLFRSPVPEKVKRRKVGPRSSTRTTSARKLRNGLGGTVTPDCGGSRARVGAGRLAWVVLFVWARAASAGRSEERRVGNGWSSGGWRRR